MKTTHTTATAAQAANVTIATIRNWCRNGVVSATKTAGRWTIQADSLNTRIQIGFDIEVGRISRKASAIAQYADLSPYKGKDDKKTAAAKKTAAEKVLALLEDGALVPTSRAGQYLAASSDGTGRYLVDTHTAECDCVSGIKRGYCGHRTAADAIEASKSNTRPVLTLIAA